MPLRFLPSERPPTEAWEKQGEDPHSITCLPVGSSGNIHAWSQQWAVTYNAGIRGAPPGMRAESHAEALTQSLQRDGLQLVRNDGSELMRVW